MHQTGHIIQIIRILSGLILFTACETEVDLIDQTDDLPVVWGIIDPSDSVYNIRIQKSFCGPGNARNMAKVYDSIYYDSLMVYLELRYAPDKTMVGYYVGQDWYGEWDMGGDLIHRARLYPVIAGVKEPGVFNHFPYRIYQTTPEEFRIHGKVNLSDPGHFTLPQGQGFLLRITVEDPATGATAVAATPFVDPPNILRPRNPLILNLFDEEPTKIIWQDHGWHYELLIQFFYHEYTDQLITKSIEWPIAGINRIKIHENQLDFYQLVATPFTETLLGHVGAGIPQDEVVTWRKFDHIDFTIKAAPGFFKDYLDSYQIAADHSGQALTNVTNGYGLFAMIATNGRKGFHLDPTSLDSLANGRYTRGLKFVKW